MTKPKRKINAKRKIKLRRLDFAIRKAVEILKNGKCDSKCSSCFLAKTFITCFQHCATCTEMKSCMKKTKIAIYSCDKLGKEAIIEIKKKLNIAVRKNMELRMEL